jgi:N-acetylmuramoyl-L-alanine amidase
MRVPIIETGLTFVRNLTAIQPIRGLVIHHTGEDDVDLSAEQIHQLHIGFAWAGIGYHFVIRKDGTVERGRPEEYQGAHSPGANGFTLGVHVCGAFANQLPNDAQMQALTGLLADKCEQYGLDPLSMITGHRDWLATECPGLMLYQEIPNIRAAVARMMQQGAG